MMWPLAKFFYPRHLQDPVLSLLATPRPRGAWWLIGRFEGFRPKGPGFESRSSRRVETLGKSFTHNCLWRFGVKLRHSIRAVSGVPLSSGTLEEAL